jgi:hypothetical protein
MIVNTKQTMEVHSVAVGKLVGNVMGHALIIQADDDTIKTELRKRGMWAHVESEVQMGRSWMLSDPTERGVDVFVWLGDPNDYGFMHYHLAGASPASPAYMALLASMHGVMKTVDKSAFFTKGGG